MSSEEKPSGEPPVAQTKVRGLDSDLCKICLVILIGLETVPPML